MAVFAIGTAPGLLALAGLPVVVPSTMRPTLLRLVGVVVIGFAFVNASAGLRLSGVTLPSFGVETAAAAPLPAGGVTAGRDAGAHHVPGRRRVQPGQRLDLRRAPRRAGRSSHPPTATCAAFLVVPDLGIQVRLHEGSNTIDLPALRPGRWPTPARWACTAGASRSWRAPRASEPDQRVTVDPGAQAAGLVSICEDREHVFSGEGSPPDDGRSSPDVPEPWASSAAR